MRLKPSPHVRYSQGKGNLGKVKNMELPWEEFALIFAEPHATGRETHAEYLKLPSDEQHKLKSVAGFVMPAHMRDGIRRRANVDTRDILSLDYDTATPKLLTQLETKLHPFCEFDFVVHTSRKHSPATPRFRMFIRLSRAIEADEFMALSRLVASRIESAFEMKQVDNVSFRVVQMMYWPTVSADSEYIYFVNEGRPLVPEEFFADFPDWKDFSKLPYAANETGGAGILRQSAGKAENPKAKNGYVGAFCRAYDVPQAIDEFLPNVYTPTGEASEKPRYSYLRGTSTSGAVIEEDGDFLYSHHGSDPCAERLVNSFDLVRTHKFGHLDNRVDNGTAPAKWPSFKAMVNFARSLPEVVKELHAAKYDLTAMFGDAEAIEAETPATDWEQTLSRDRNGRVENNVYNVVNIAQNDPRMRGIVEKNEFRDQIVTRHAIRSKMSVLAPWPISDPINGDVVEDLHLDMVRTFYAAESGIGKAGWGLNVSDRDVSAALNLYASKSVFNPVKEMLESVRWDGNNRVDELFVRYLGAEDNVYHRAVASKFLIAAVARIYEPGHKFDFVPILEGVQGKRKSTFIGALAMCWSGDLKGDFKDERRMVEQMRGAWILEIPELSALNRSIIEDVKAFISANQSSVREAYARLPKVFKRRCVFMGSTNEHEYLVDNTGNRRWWPIRCTVTEIDTDHLRANLHQIWAEALALYRKMRQDQPSGMLPLYLDCDDAAEIALAYQEDRRQKSESDHLAGMISEWLDRPTTIGGFEDLDENGSPVQRSATCILQVWREVLSEKGVPPRHSSNSIGRALRSIGWSPGARTEYLPGFGPQKVWRSDKQNLAQI